MIKLDNVTKDYGDVRAVCKLTLNVPSGELFCFLGPNGAGKTTTIKMMCGLLRVSSGAIHIGGYDLAREPDKARKITGYIPDTPFLYERLTPAEYFEFVGDLYQIPNNEITFERDKSFRLFNLRKYAHTLIKDLSHGYRQRLIYAATFLHKPKVLFIDEPFIGLDPYTIRLIHDLLREKAASGMTIFLTSHILALIEKLADRIGIIAEGRLIASGTLDELRSLSLRTHGAGAPGLPRAGRSLPDQGQHENQSLVQKPLEDIFLHLTGAEKGVELDG